MAKPQTSSNKPAAAPAKDIEEMEAAIAASEIIDEEDEQAAAAEDAKTPSKTRDAKRVNVTADADLRVIIPDTLGVFVLKKNVTRTLPRKLAMAAQVAGGAQDVVVTVKD